MDNRHVALDEELLSAARASLAAVDEAAHRLMEARESSRRAIRALYAGGGSLREIAAALQVSHQRVHQLVEGSGQTAAVVQLPRCSFCGADQSRRQKLVAGAKGVAICERCSEAASGLLEAWTAGGSNSRRLEPALDVVVARKACSFCGKKPPRQVPAVATGLSGVSICTPCLALCHEIYDEEAADGTSS